MSTKPTVSVVIPTHNRAMLLPETLDSVFAQEGAGTQFEMEVIVADDASSDATPAVVRRYPNARYVRLPTNRGSSAARNAGIRASSGTYVAFLDDDDLWLPHRLKVQIPAMEAHPEVGLVYGQLVARTSDHEYVLPDSRYAPSGSVLGPLLMGNFVGTLTVLARRTAIERAGYFDESVPGVEDYDLWIRMALHVPFLFVAGPVAVYRVGPQSKQLAEVADGRFGQLLLHVLERALEALPDTETYAAIRRETQTCLEFQTASRLVFNHHTDAARPRLEAALRLLPAMPHQQYALPTLARFIGQLAVASPSPVTATRVLADELMRISRRIGPRQRTWVNRLLSEAWAEAAIHLGFGSAEHDRAAARAALSSALHNPLTLARRRPLLWLLARGIAGRRVDPLFERLRRKRLAHRMGTQP